jgi:ATP-binding cassette subfamily B protein
MDTFLYKDFDEDGVDISGGEEQKIAIARALYQNAAFLILDEPTAALDPVAEYEIYTRLNDMVGERTAVYISHRLSSCKFCDEIVVFDHGQIVEQGSHEALLAKEDGKYTALWNAQAQYYVKNPGVESL